MMHRMMVALAAFYRRWRYVEEEAGAGEPAAATVPPADREDLRLRRAIALEERRVADYRRNGCPALAREREATLRSLRTRLAALEL
ncbi:MAG TPA: hypothetical protein VJB14_10070 [Planctomycetota bacterium]|nr:hypothetical protein [Planctomycetota bacterium]